MANRVNVEDVREIFDSSLTDVQLSPYIDVANSIVTDKLGSSTLGDSRLADIERFLTAHIVSLTRSREGVEEKIGEARVKYADIFGKGLEATSFGQMVMVLDTTGKLHNMSRRALKITAIKSFEDD